MPPGVCTALSGCWKQAKLRIELGLSIALLQASHTGLAAGVRCVRRAQRPRRIDTSPIWSRYSDLVWRHPAKRCFPSCSDSTHPITHIELRGTKGKLARRVTRARWSFGGAISALEFAMTPGEARPLNATQPAFAHGPLPDWVSGWVSGRHQSEAVVLEDRYLEVLAFIRDMRAPAPLITLPTTLLRRSRAAHYAMGTWHLGACPLSR